MGRHFRASYFSICKTGGLIPTFLMGLSRGLRTITYVEVLSKQEVLNNYCLGTSWPPWTVLMWGLSQPLANVCGRHTACILDYTIYKMKKKFFFF